ncbi:contractile injection system tape measure protein [Aquimarina sp. 2304DJ70-9]|uniref:contractile injection system tape measure protein n=1 Tax=Aquimarina penaris TaxID=3231044 RepID=UPI003462E622
MMTQQKHIINKQILEVHLPSTVDAFAVQQELSALCRHQLRTVMDRIFDNTAHNAGDQPLQIDRLTLDLGQVSLDNFETVFEEELQEKLQEVLTVYQQSDAVVQKNTVNQTEEKTPLRAVAHYLKTGILPWWAKDRTKAYVLEQLEELLQKPNTTFITLLKQLRWNTQQLERFVHTSTEAQLLQSLQLVSDIPVQEIVPTLEKFQQRIHKKYGIALQKIQAAFWKTAFQKFDTYKDVKFFEQECFQGTLAVLGIDQKGNSKKHQAQDVYEIKSLVASYKTAQAKNTVWQEFFRQLSTIINNPFLDQLPAKMLKQWVQLLKDIGNIQEQTVDANSVLRPLAIYLQGVHKELQEIASKPAIMEIEKVSSPFEDTDFIPIQNAGLVLFWPFLERFFENLELIKDKNFINETARHTAICALQYLCEGDDQELFEGALPLNKLLCGVAIEEVISPITLSDQETAIAEGLLTAAIGQGPHWKNLSIEGFRISYLCRPGSLRTRDGHWLLQVQRETHDVTLEKLPWGFHTVKLPWMQDIIVVEWL